MGKKEIVKVAVKALVGVGISLVGEIFVYIFASDIAAKIKARLGKKKLDDMTVSEMDGADLRRLIREELEKEGLAQNSN